MRLGRKTKVVSPLDPLAPPSFVVQRALNLSEFAKDLRGTLKLARAHQLMAWSASLAFYCLFALVPMLILCFVVSRRLFPQFHDPESASSLKALLEILLPTVAPLVSENLVNVAQRNLVADALSVILLGWSTYGLFVSLHSVFENISASGKTRNFFWSNTVSVFCFGIVFASCTTFLFLTTTNAALIRLVLGPYLANVDLALIRWAASTLSLVTVIGAITIVYKLMPTRQIRWVFALRASFMFAAFFLGGRACFQLYVSYYQSMNETIYGAFMAFMTVVIWIYYLTRTFLFSAQYAIYLEEKNTRH